MKLDKTKTYAIVAGHAEAAFEQNGRLFDGAGNLVGDEPAEPAPKDKIIETDEVASAKSFLTQILKEGPLRKSVVYSEAGKNNQAWPDVQKAHQLMGIAKSLRNKEEFWALPEA